MKQVTLSELETGDFYYGYTEATDFNENIPTHTHNTCELLFVTKGNLTYVVEGKHYPVSKNTLIISRALAAHAILPKAPTEYFRHNIIVDETKCGANIFPLIPPNIDVMNLSGNEQICGLFKKMEYYCGNAQGAVLETLLRNLTEEILYNIVLISREQNISSTSTSNAVVMQALQYINENITDPLPITKICEALYITKSHLHRMFMTHLNTTPKKYIMVKKLRMAQAEMQAGGHPSEVAVRYGFANYATFYRNYKEHFGVIPSEWSEVAIDRAYF